MNDNYDLSYDQSAHYFGEEAEPFLVDNLKFLDKAHTVLDIGSGQGRNAIFLAEKSFSVIALDPSQVASRDLDTLAEKEKLDLTTVTKSFEQYDSGETKFGGILVFGLIPILSRSGIVTILDKIENWLIPEGIVYITAFTVLDHGYDQFLQKGFAIETGSFLTADGSSRTFLVENELKDLFEKKGYQILVYEEKPGPVHRHADGPEEQHHWASLICKKRVQT